jgi:hypothetical protein
MVVTDTFSTLSATAIKDGSATVVEKPINPAKRYIQ